MPFLKELRSALNWRYGITATLPSSYQYLQHFDAADMEQYLDWFNMMSESNHRPFAVPPTKHACFAEQSHNSV